MGKILPKHAMACPPGGPLDYPMISLPFFRTNSHELAFTKYDGHPNSSCPCIDYANWNRNIKPSLISTTLKPSNYMVPLFHTQIQRKRDLSKTFLLLDFQMDPTSSAVPCWGQTGLSMVYSFYSQGRAIHGLDGAEEFVTHPTYIADLILRLASGPWTEGCGWFQFLAKYTCSLC